MAIDLTGLSSTPSTSTRSKLDGLGAQQTAEKQPHSTDLSAPAETVKLSTEALSLQKLEEQVGQLPDVDAERVASIKQSIADGSYHVDAEQLADNILQFEDSTYG